MYHPNLLPLVSFSFCSSIAIAVILRRRWNVIAVSFCLVMASLAIMELSNLMALNSLTIEKMFYWKKFSLVFEMLFSVNCLVFSLVFAKKEPRKVLKKWRWGIISAYALPVIVLVYLFYTGQMVVLDTSRIIGLSQIAKYFYIFPFIILIVSLMNLENTFRSSSSSEKWHIKYMVFGLGALLIFFIYILSQRLLYNTIEMRNIYIMSTVILAAGLLMIYSIIRNKIIDGDIYISRKVIYSSISLIAIGIYSVIVALFAQILRSFEIQKNLKFDTLLIFFAALVLVIVFYKESFRRKAKIIINKSFRKSKYVYHDEWVIFSTELSKKITTKEICESFLKLLSERMFVKHLSLWLVDDNKKKLHMIHSHHIEKPTPKLELNFKAIDYIFEKGKPVNKRDILASKNFKLLDDEFLAIIKVTKAEILVPLMLAEKRVGLLTMGKVRTGEDYDETEDYDLLMSAAAHAASAINNARLFEDKIRAGEMEAFHRLSSFIIHDVKNTMSILSIVSENAKKHFHDPDFQKDALRTISGVVAKMQRMIGNLSNLPHRLELNLENCDLNVLIEEALEGTPINGSSRVKIDRKLCPIPPIRADVEEINKVVNNLILNACEAGDGKGIVRVNTRLNGEKVVLTVTDDGCGISKEFIENSLFRPLKSTKRNGLGIGLYQCKTIIEAHGGSIEVQSECGEGTTFSVFLPIAQSARVAVGFERSAVSDQLSGVSNQ
jgi:putative PEP-CTERM system histidine kinase